MGTEVQSAAIAARWRTMARHRDPVTRLLTGSGEATMSGCSTPDGALASPSSSGLGHRPLTPKTGVRVPLGTPLLSDRPQFRRLVSSRRLVVVRRCFHVLAAILGRYATRRWCAVPRTRLVTTRRGYARSTIPGVIRWIRTPAIGHLSLGHGTLIILG